MPWPVSQDYNEAVQTPVQSFSDADLKQTEAKCNAIGIPMPRSGNFADVYEMTGPGGKKWAVKCFTRQVPGLRERYAAISAYLQQVNLPFMVDFAYLEQGIRIKGQWYPILKMDWVEGFGLNQFVQEHADNPPVLELLAQIWLRLAQRLREAKMAHADLQHGNVLLVPGSQARSLAVRLIDYDGMFVPALARTKSGEVGHPAYQHPQRLRDGTYNAEVDRFPHLVIYTALRSLMVGGRYLWNKYNNGDNLLFRQADLNEPGKSALFAELLKLNDAELRKLVQTLAQSVPKPLEQTPLLEELTGGPAKRKAAVVAGTAQQATPGEVFAQAAAGDVIRRPRRASQRSYVGVVMVGLLAVAGLAVAGVMLTTRSKPSENGAAVAVASSPAHPSRRIVSSKPETNSKSSQPDTKSKSSQPDTDVKPKDPPSPEPQPRSQPTQAPPAVGAAALTLQGHTDGVNGVAFSPDGKHIVSGSGDSTVKVWNAQTGKLDRTLQGHGDRVLCVAFSPDGKRIASGSADKTLKIWSAQTGQLERTLQGHSQRVTSLAFSPDGKRLVSGSGDKAIKVWNAQTGGLEHTLDGHTRWVVCVAFSPDSKRIVSGSANRESTLKVWDAQTGQEERSFAAHASGVTTVAVSPDGKRILSSGWDKAVKLWNAQTGQLVNSLDSHSEGVRSAAFSPDGKHIVSGSLDKTLKVWDAQTGREEATLQGHTDQVESAAFSPDGTRVVSGSADRTIKVWDLPTKMATKPDPEIGVAPTITNSVGMKLARVPAGTFWMGGGGGKPGTKQVTIPHDFYLGVYPVTQGEWQTVMGKNPSCFSRTGVGRLSVKDITDADLQQFPVEQVSWEDAQQFIRKLNEREKDKGWLYRLPSEAEWEYACRGAASTPEDSAFDFYFDRPSNDLSSLQANFDGNRPAGGAAKGPHVQRTTKVGSYPPNRLGLYDMHGNVWQWCDDWYTEGSDRVRRGGSWRYGSGLCRAAFRSNSPVAGRYSDLGFRVVRVPAATAQAKYLVDMQEFDVKEHPNPLYRFLKGMAGGKVISVDGVSSPHGLCMHPPSKSYSSATYRIPKGSKRFQSGVAINDTAAKQTVRTPVTFHVFGDGRLLWESKPIQAARQTQSCDVSLKGIGVLELRVTCPGPDDAAHAVWIEPLIRN